MKVTFGSLKEYTRSRISTKSTREAILGAFSLMKADPLDMEVRFIITDLLISIGRKDLLAPFITSSAELAVVSGHGACAFSFTAMLRDLGFDVQPAIEQIAEFYSSESSVISEYGTRTAPLPADSAVDGPEDLSNTDEDILNNIVTYSADRTSWSELPEKLLPMPLLSDLDKPSFLTITKGYRLNRLKKGDFVIREGEPGNSFFICALGSLDVFKSDTYGRQSHLASLHDGAIFGEMALVQLAPRSASVVSTGFAEVIEFHASNLAEMAGELPIVAKALDKFTRDRLITNLMNNSAFFKPFTRKQRKDLLRHFQAYVVDTDTVILREGDEGTGLYLVLSGEVDIIKDLRGQNEVKVATLGATESFGEISLITDNPTSASCVAARRSTLLFLARHYFTRLIQSVPELKTYFEMLSLNRIAETKSLLEEIENEEEEEFILI